MSYRRSIKVFSLAAVAAVAAMAFIGASSASAVTLCKVLQNPCAEGNRWPVPQEIHAVLAAGTKATLAAGPINDECTESLIKGKTTANDGLNAAGGLLGLIETVTFGGSCTCQTQIAIHLPWKFKLLSEVTEKIKEDEGADNGLLHVFQDGKGNPGGLVICEGNHCEYTTSEALATVTGGNPGFVTAEVKLPTIGGDFICFFGGAAVWKAKYEILTPKPAWVSALP